VLFASILRYDMPVIIRERLLTMQRWVILKTDNGSEYLNLDMATRILHNERNQEYIIEYSTGRVHVWKEHNPATYAHIAAYLGDLEV
jgi:hypothetical protein